MALLRLPRCPLSRPTRLHWPSLALDASIDLSDTLFAARPIPLPPCLGLAGPQPGASVCPMFCWVCSLVGGLTVHRGPFPRARSAAVARRPLSGRSRPRLLRSHGVKHAGALASGQAHAVRLGQLGAEGRPLPCLIGHVPLSDSHLGVCFGGQDVFYLPETTVRKREASRAPPASALSAFRQTDPLPVTDTQCSVAPRADQPRFLWMRCEADSLCCCQQH